MRLLRTVPSPRRTRVRRSDRVPFLELVEPRLLPANMVFTVNSAADDPSGPTPGIVTLRDAINKVNNDPTDVASNPDVIKFAISGTPTISLAADLPAITAPVFIDGASQHGYSGTPLIQINGLTHGVQGSGLVLNPGSGSSTIRGLDIYGFSLAGMAMSGAGSNTVTGCTFSGNSIYGVYMAGADNTVTGCTFSGNSVDGVFMSNADFNAFTGCTFSGNLYEGAEMDSVFDTSFKSCNFTGNSDGVLMSTSGNNTSPNTFTGCTFSGNSFSGVEMLRGEFNTFTGCTISGNKADGVKMSGGSFSNTLTGCNFSSNGSDGMEMLAARSNTVTGCTFSGNSANGVYMSGDDSTFKSCNFSSNGTTGMLMSVARSNTVTGCTFSGNSANGVYMADAVSNTFTSCIFSGNLTNDGVYMAGSSSNTFTGCILSGNSLDGIYMAGVDSNTFISCNFSSNGFAGMEMSAARSNTVTGCIFSGNSNDGVYISGASSKSNTFTGCTFSVNSVDGVFMSGVNSNTFQSCNFFSNRSAGMEMSAAMSNTVTGCTMAGNNNAGILINTMSEDNVIDENYIVGTPSNGSSTQQVGILINDSINNTIGGTTAGSTTPANVIGGNNVGIEITGFNSNLTGGNVIEGNYIGVTEDGSAIGNLYGIWIDDVPFNTIGGTDKGAGNTISDNEWAGVYIFGPDATGNLVEGNSILGPNNRGTKTSPTNPLPIGVFIQNSSSNTIGGAGAGNTIYGNNVGVYIVGTGGASTNNQVLGNFIGLSANGASRPGNVLYGVILVNAPNNNVPQSGPSANKIVGSGIANYREYSGPIDPTTQSSSGSKANKPAHHSNHVAHQSPRRTALHAQVTVHGHTVPAGPLRKPRARVRH